MLKIICKNKCTHSQILSITITITITAAAAYGVVTLARRPQYCCRVVVWLLPPERKTSGSSYSVTKGPLPFPGAPFQTVITTRKVQEPAKIWLSAWTTSSFPQWSGKVRCISLWEANPNRSHNNLCCILRDTTFLSFYLILIWVDLLSSFWLFFFRDCILFPIWLP